MADVIDGAIDALHARDREGALEDTGFGAGPEHSLTTYGSSPGIHYCPDEIHVGKEPPIETQGPGRHLDRLTLVYNNEAGQDADALDFRSGLVEPG